MVLETLYLSLPWMKCTIAFNLRRPQRGNFDETTGIKVDSLQQFESTYTKHKQKDAEKLYKRKPPLSKEELNQEHPMRPLLRLIKPRKNLPTFSPKESSIVLKIKLNFYIRSSLEFVRLYNC